MKSLVQDSKPLKDGIVSIGHSANSPLAKTEFEHRMSVQGTYEQWAIGKTQNQLT